MRKYVILGILLAFTMVVLAAERPSAQMRQAALKTLNSTKAERVFSQSTLDVYSDGERFSIVSRDDRFPEVLAYGFGHFDMSEAPDNVRWWLDRIQHSMERAIEENVLRHSARTYVPIAPMMETKWGQGTPYNNYAPIVGKEKAPAGCMATAMAQMMNYQQYPASASFDGSYVIGSLVYKERISSTYLWPYQLAYGAYMATADAGEVARMSYTPKQGNNVAALLRDCGYAVNMAYDSNGSGSITFDAGVAFADKFGYPRESVKYLMREYYTDEEWMDMLYAELASNSPVLYAGGSDRSGGHAFVIHGMDAEGLAFVNWGWQGQFDGYYAIDVLNPGGEDFSDGEEMVIGVRSASLPTDAVQSCFATDLPYEFSYNNVTKELTIKFTSFVFNATCYAFTGRWCLVAESMDDSGKTKLFDMLDEGFVLEGYYGFAPWSDSDTFTFEPGSYRIYFATQDVGEVNWQYIRTVGGAFYYDMSVAADGAVTIASVPTFVALESDVPLAIHKEYQSTLTASPIIRYYDLQGREVGSDARGLVIMKQGDMIKKVFK